MQSHEPLNSFESVPQRIDYGRDWASSAPTLRFHRVAPGETLTRIAEEWYGDGSFWVLIYGANERVLRERGGLYPGLPLYLPFL